MSPEKPDPSSPDSPHEETAELLLAQRPGLVNEHLYRASLSVAEESPEVSRLLLTYGPRRQRDPRGAAHLSYKRPDELP